jgi:hypothetical protein
LIPVAERRFRIGTSPVELEFLPNGDAVQRVHAWPPRQPVTLKRHDSAPVGRSDLAPYVGTYYSEELGATYTVTTNDTVLVLRTRWGEERRVSPVFGDTFSGDFLLTFTRGRARAVDGMLMSSGRVRRVRFEKRAG